MHFLQTNAVDLNGLLVALKNFLSANGWTILADGTGGGGLALEVTNANGHSFKFSSITQNQNVYTPAGAGPTVFVERLLQIAFQKSDIGLAAGYTAKPAKVNDMTGPFSNVWLFTDDAASYCHVVMQTANARYNHFSFGDIDNKGMHAIQVPYAFGMYHVWWQWTPLYTGNNSSACAFTDFSTGSHRIGFYCEGSATEDINFASDVTRIGVPDGLLDPALGFTDGPLETQFVRPNCSRHTFPTVGGNNTGRPLDYMDHFDNQGYTGGVPIFPAPVTIKTPNDLVHTLIGEWPGIGSVNVDGLSPGQELDFAGEVWMCFPIKQYGTQAARNNGTNPQPFTNTLNYGIAVKKVDA